MYFFDFKNIMAGNVISTTLGSNFSTFFGSLIPKNSLMIEGVITTLLLLTKMPTDPSLEPLQRIHRLTFYSPKRGVIVSFTPCLFAIKLGMAESVNMSISMVLSKCSLWFERSLWWIDGEGDLGGSEGVGEGDLAFLLLELSILSFKSLNRRMLLSFTLTLHPIKSKEND